MRFLSKKRCKIKICSKRKLNDMEFNEKYSKKTWNTVDYKYPIRIIKVLSEIWDQVEFQTTEKW